MSVVSGAAFGPEGNPQGGMGTDAGDLDGDGLPDILVANFEGETNEHYRNLGSGIFEDVTLTSGFGLPVRTAVGFGLNLFDAENDGDLDAFIANGHVSERPAPGHDLRPEALPDVERRPRPVPGTRMRTGLRVAFRRAGLGRGRLRQRRRRRHRRFGLRRPAPAAAQ